MQTVEFDKIEIKVIPPAMAKDYTLKNHYMKTYPNSAVAFGVFYGKKLSGVISFGYSTSTNEKVSKILPNIEGKKILEMTRMNLADYMGKNAESFVLGQIMGLLREKGVDLVITHAGGCKNDCGIVYQASSWLYFGKEKCNDFYYVEETGEYKNIVAPMRFGRVPKGIKGGQAVGEFLFGKGKLIDSWRYYYVYPIKKGLRKWLEKKSLKYPKDSAIFRKDGEWITNGRNQ